MFTLRSAIYASVLAIPMFFSGNAANAAVVTGSSGGSFSNIASCDGNCRINTTTNGANTQLEWGYTNGFLGIGAQPGSTLTAVDRAWSVSTNANDVILAELVWFNKATSSNATPDSFTARYTLGINFTSPNAANDTEPFELTITNPTNSAGDLINGLLMADLANLSFNLGNVVMSDLKYMLGGGGGSFSSNTWFNPENTTSRLYITADFREKPAMVPEPASLGLLAIGFLGLGIGMRRRQA